MTQPKPRVAIFDWDGTVISGFTIMRWSEFLTLRKLFDPASLDRMKLAVRAYTRQDIGYRSMAERMVFAYAGGTTGLACEDLRQILTEFVESEIPLLFPYARVAIPWLHDHNVGIVVMTGSPEEVVRGFKSVLPLDEVFGSRVEADSQGHLTGRVTANGGLVRTKLATVRTIKMQREVLLAFGDSEADAPILAAARQPFLVGGCQAMLSNIDNLITVDPDAGLSELMDNLKRLI